MDLDDRAEFVRQAGDALLPRTGHFLEASALVNWEKALSGSSTAGEVERLQKYRRSFYWLMPKHRNLVQLPAYLIAAARGIDPKAPWAKVLVLDLAWLYLLSILYAVEEITKLHLKESTAALRQVVVGSEQDVREKEAWGEELRRLIEAAQPDPKRRPQVFDVLPSYFPDLLDTVSRVSRRRALATEALRALEFTGVETLANRGASYSEAFPDHDPLAPKMASDVVRFLVRAAALDTSFVSAFDHAVSGLANTHISDPEPIAQIPSARSSSAFSGAAVEDGGQQSIPRETVSTPNQPELFVTRTGVTDGDPKETQGAQVTSATPDGPQPALGDLPDSSG
jgi:hypothetical protein